jgi:hypothetical protein
MKRQPIGVLNAHRCFAEEMPEYGRIVLLLSDENLRSFKWFPSFKRSIDLSIWPGKMFKQEAAAYMVYDANKANIQQILPLAWRPGASIHAQERLRGQNVLEFIHKQDDI